VGESDRDRWKLVRLDPREPTRDLAESLSHLPAATLCFHDADHSYLGQLDEFTRFWERLAPGGVLVADDVDASYALIDFAESSEAAPSLLIDGRKVVGVLRRERQSQ
jgi:hypothetical protein